MMKNLLIVESPAKAKTIKKYLGKNYEVVASFGHIRNLVNKSGSVDVENDFKMKYEISRGSGKHINEIISKVKKTENLILSPDPDREGEAIAWHILQVLQQKKALKNIKKINRVTFNSVTKSSIQEAIKNPRNIDENLVNSQQSRVALDYLVGFTISPILWRKLPGTRSAGRVQSVALRMICDREDEIKKFKSEEYWTILAEFNEVIEANLTHVEGNKLAKLDIKNQQQANIICHNLENKTFKISEIDEKNVNRKPYPPLNTSALQQDASRKLGFSTKKTMSVAQSLYEGVNLGKETEGLITYMRTDSINIEPTAIKNIRTFILEKFGEKYLPKSPNIYKTKAKNAQEAHEAVRPTNISRAPDEIKDFLTNDQFKLYDLIWRRTLASQFANMITKQTAIIIKTFPDYALLKANYSQVIFQGFDILFPKKEDKNKSVPNIKIEEKLALNKLIPNQHFTEPPARYNEASLVKKMEELGVGRPSTYASIISVLQDRKYVKLENKRFIAEQRGSILTSFLKNFFSQYVKYDYTAKVENDLDLISDGRLKWKEFLYNFWDKFNIISKSAEEKSIDDILKVINQEMRLFVFEKDENGKLKDNCPSCNNGKLSIKLGKFGSFLGCSNYPDCKYINNIDGESDGSSVNLELVKDKIIAIHKQTNKNIILKKGPYGFYLELEVDNNIAQETNSKKKTKPKKPKRVSIPRDISIENIDQKKANELINLPRLVGVNPDNGLEIKANFGPYGPYLLHEKIFYSVKNDDILTIDIPKALEIIKEGKNKKGKKNKL